MKNLVIIGARGFGREAYNGFCAFYADDNGWHCKGFLDSDPHVLDGYEGYPPIIGAPETYEIQKDDCFFCAMGDVHWRKHYAEMIMERGGEFVSLISPKCVIGRNSKVGKGCYIEGNVSVSCDIVIGDFSFVFGPTVLGHDAKVGNYCHLGALSFLGGYCQLEDLVTMHPGAQLLPHKTIKTNSIVGAGSVVIRNVQENSTVVGVPAKKIEYK